MKASFSKFVKNDFVALLLAIGGPIALAVAAFAGVFGFLPSVRNRGGQAIDPRGQIEIALEPDNPKKAFVVRLYSTP